MTAERTLTPEIGPRSRTPTLPPIPSDYDRLEPLYQIQTVLAQTIGIEQACDAVLAIVTRVLRVRTAILLDMTKELQRAMVWAAAGIASTEIDNAREHARQTYGYLARGVTASMNAVSRGAVLPTGVAEKTLPARRFVTLPLVVHGQVFGVFQLEEATAFDERDLMFVNVVVNQLAVAFDRHHVQVELAGSRAEVERANGHLRDLQAISEAALQGETLDEALVAVLDAMRSIFATDAAAVLLVSADGKTLRRRASIGLHDGDDLEIRVGTGAVGRIAANGTEMFFDDLEDIDGVRLRANAIRSLLGAPMRARQRPVGVVYVASRKHRGFTSEELHLLELVADRLGTIIENARLYEQALAAIRSRDVVMGVVSHDLRNPLSAIQMCAELLPADDPQIVKLLAIIKSSVDVMVRLIADLRDVGSIEAEHLSIRTQPEHADLMIREAIEGVRDTAAKKAVEIAAGSATRDLVVQCDRIRVIQVLTNLMSNAIKFTPRGGSIAITMSEAPGFARFSVADTGCGIPEVDLPFVFDRYWQAEGTAHLGTGLGLTIAKGIVETHGGTMAVESDVGRGTTFSFTVPLARASVGAASDAARDRVASPHAPTGGTGYRVLVVDDEPNARSALAALLEDDGFIVETAADGLRALPKVREFAPDIMLVDVEMPGLRGDDFVRRVRADLAELPVILMTGHGEHVVAGAKMELRTSYITKPLDIDELISAIHRELHKEP